MNDVFHSIDVTENVPVKNEDSDEEIAAVDAGETNLFPAVERNPPVQYGLNGQNLDKATYLHNMELLLENGLMELTDWHLK